MTVENTAASRARRSGGSWLALVLCILGATPSARAATPVIGTSTAGDPMLAGHKYYTHWVNGHYWVAYDNGGVGCSFYSSPDGVTWTSQGAIFSSLSPNSFNNEWAVRYLGAAVIAAALDGTSNRIYRSGTLNSNGTVTWSAESAAGPPDATFNALNLLVANGRPVMWRDDATPGGAGALWRGNAISSPTWTKTGANAPAMSVGGASSGVFTAGALFQTGGADPNDLIVLRSTSAAAHSIGSHRLVAMKWNAATDAYDAAWYDVSTLGGTLIEDPTTEVQVGDDNTNQKRFAAVRDSSGNIHAVYVNRNGDMVHYRKGVGFNDSWTRVSAGINPLAETIDRVGLTALASNNLHLFYSKSDASIYYRRFDGASWGPESLLQDLSATGLRSGLAPPEAAIDCSGGFAFVEGMAPPWNVRFTLGVGSCSTLQATEGTGTVTVTGPGSFEITFDQLRGGGLASFYDLAEDPGRAYDLAGKPSVNFYGLFHSGWVSGGIMYATGTNSVGAKLDLLEATPTRVRVRQEAFYQRVPPPTDHLAGAKGIGDYSVYPERVALRWNRRTTLPVPQTDHALEIGVRREVAPDPRDTLNSYSQNSSSSPASATDDFILAQREVANVRTDFLAILSERTGANDDWEAADVLDWNVTSRFHAWRDNGPIASPVPAGSSEKWDFLIHYKPTNFLSNLDPAVTSRSSDFRGPDALGILVGAPWQSSSENTIADNFNEAEAAYALTLDPTLGLTVQIDGSAAAPRYRPFFKIRQWRSLVPQTTVTLDGATLTRNVEYKADVKPVARAHFAPGTSWHSTLEGQMEVDTSPDIGDPGSVVGSPTFVPARYGNGVGITLASQHVAFDTSTSNFNGAIGAIEFWFQPAFDNTDGVLHDICGFVSNPNNRFVLEKRADNNLYFAITAAGTPVEMSVSAANYSWRASEWVHLRIDWDDSAPLGFQQRLYLNGVEPAHTDPTVDYVSAGLNIATQFRFGNADGNAAFSPGIYDEVYVYGGFSATPMPLAHGGLTSNASEYLADPSKDFGLSLAGVDADRRGRYFYLGSDSQFRGLNIELAVPGAGVPAGAILWEYWNGASWADLTAAGLTDITSSFTKSGTVYWTGDPFGWSPYSVNGGPDLYYVRAHLLSGFTYAPSPVENVIKTDILLFQYCGDITSNGQTFSLAAPTPTGTTADLAITKTDGVTSEVPGTAVSYTITVTNGGPDTVLSLIVTDLNPAILSPTFTPSTGAYDPVTGLWTGLSLAATQDVTLTLAGTIDPLARGDLVNTATVTAPAGATDPDQTNNSWTDTDTLVPSVDLALTKTGDPDPVGLGSVLTYTLDVTSGPSGATAVTLTDTLPPSMLFESATPTQGSCSYDGSTRTVTCNLGPVGSSSQVILKVRPQAVGAFVNTARVQGTEDPGPGGNNTATWTTNVQVFTSDVRFFTVTSTSEKNVLEWVNPTADYVSTEIRFRTDGYPKDASDGTLFYSGGVAGGQEKRTHLTGLGSNGVTYYYGAFVHRTALPDSPGRFVTGRPFDHITGPAKWAFSTGATAVSPPTVGGAGVVAPSNDRVLYAMERGPAAPSGEWPANWWPIELGDVVQSRSPVVPISVLGADPVVYLGAQDGNVYTVDATQGGKVGFPWVTASPLAPTVQAAPAGIFSAFDGTLTFDYLLVGTRDGSGPNAFFLLDPFTGFEVARFDNAGAGLGIINGMASVDYATRRVYFASHEWGAGTNTLWCLELRDSAPFFELKWARALGDIDSSPVLRRGRVYVGNNGTVFSIDALAGDNPLLDRTFVHGDGQVKGFVFPDRSSDDIYFATENYVWAVSDLAGGMSNKFAGGISLGGGTKPSAVLFLPGSHYVYVGGSDGKLHEIDVAGGPPWQKTLPLGYGTVGAPSLDRGYGLLHVGTEAGVFYAVEAPLPSGAAMCVASCAAQLDGTPCSCFGINPCTESCVSGACSDSGGC